jgi:hypothetical protein
MRCRHGAFNGPFLESYSFGFRLYRSDAMNLQHPTIEGVSRNGEKREAFFLTLMT